MRLPHLKKPSSTKEGYKPPRGKGKASYGKGIASIGAIATLGLAGLPAVASAAETDWETFSQGSDSARWEVSVCYEVTQEWKDQVSKSGIDNPYEANLLLEGSNVSLECDWSAAPLASDRINGGRWINDQRTEMYDDALAKKLHQSTGIQGPFIVTGETTDDNGNLVRTVKPGFFPNYRSLLFDASPGGEYNVSVQVPDSNIDTGISGETSEYTEPSVPRADDIYWEKFYPGGTPTGTINYGVNKSTDLPDFTLSGIGVAEICWSEPCPIDSRRSITITGWGHGEYTQVATEAPAGEAYKNFASITDPNGNDSFGKLGDTITWNVLFNTTAGQARFTDELAGIDTTVLTPFKETGDINYPYIVDMPITYEIQASDLVPKEDGSCYVTNSATMLFSNPLTRDLSREVIATSSVPLSCDGATAIEVKPSNPEVTQAKCTEDGKTTIPPTVKLQETEGITYTIDGEVAPGNTVKVIAKADAGYTLTAASGWTYDPSSKTSTRNFRLVAVSCEDGEGTGGETGGETPTPPTAVVPGIPSLSPAKECGVEATVTIPNTAGVDYSQSRDGDVVTVTAKAKTGYVITEGSTTSWTFTIPAIEECTHASVAITKNGDTVKEVVDPGEYEIKIVVTNDGYQPIDNISVTDVTDSGNDVAWDSEQIAGLKDLTLEVGKTYEITGTVEVGEDAIHKDTATVTATGVEDTDDNVTASDSTSLVPPALDNENSEGSGSGSGSSSGSDGEGLADTGANDPLVFVASSLFIVGLAALARFRSSLVRN